MTSKIFFLHPFSLEVNSGVVVIKHIHEFVMLLPLKGGIYIYTLESE